MSNILPESITRLIQELQRLPGIGPKMAGRLAIYLLQRSVEETDRLSQAVALLKQGIVHCRVCGHFTTESVQPCAICTDEQRDGTLLCVVEESLDVVAIEKTHSFTGRYHVLGGVISPIDGIGPDQLSIAALLTRVVSDQHLTEVVLATNPSLEGEATATYIKSELIAALNKGQRQLSITRIARGLPTGGALEYADIVTLTQAFEGRQRL